MDPQVNKIPQQQFRNFGAFQRSVGSNNTNYEKKIHSAWTQNVQPEYPLADVLKTRRDSHERLHLIVCLSDIFTKYEEKGSICFLVLFKNVIIQPKFSYAEQCSTFELIMS